MMEWLPLLLTRTCQLNLVAWRTLNKSMETSLHVLTLLGGSMPVTWINILEKIPSNQSENRFSIVWRTGTTDSTYPIPPYIGIVSLISPPLSVGGPKLDEPRSAPLRNILDRKGIDLAKINATNLIATFDKFLTWDVIGILWQKDAGSQLSGEPPYPLFLLHSAQMCDLRPIHV